MNLFTAIFTTMALLASTSTEAQTMVISRAGSRPVRPAPTETFTGSVRVEMLFDALDPSHASGGSVTFEPGARTAWHSHPRGQILIVTAGTGRVQRWGDPIEEIRSGDVVRIPAGEKHWHGASRQASMTHIAITEHQDGTAVQWMEKVSDEQYNAAPQPQPAAQQQGTTRPSGSLQQKLAPGLATLTDDVLFGDVWRRPELSPRDRSLVTISVLIATGKPAQLAGHLSRALDNGVQPREASGVLAHLAIYSGWPNAVSALDVYEQVYTARKVDTTTLRDAGSRLPPFASDTSRRQASNDELAAIAPKFVQLTNDVVFDDLWRRADLTMRDRSLVTIAALAAMGDDDHLDFYLRRAIESGLTRAQITEAFTHLGFYAGWPKATKAITAVTGTLGNDTRRGSTAFDRGVTFYNAAEAYGPHEVERILGEAVASETRS
jgi:4-carboxymuconolactone decarboxylase